MDSRRLGFVLGVVLGLCPSVAMQADGSEDEKPLYKDATAPVERRVDDLLRRMTLEEKVMQVNQYSLGRNNNENNAGAVARVPAEIGSVIYYDQDPALRNDFQRKAVEQTRLGIPVLFGHDVIHGFRTITPIPLAQSCSWNPELVTQVCAQSALEASRAGVDWTFSPMIDVAHDPRWGRVAEGYGEDPYATGVYAAAAVRGYQGDTLSAEGSLAACLKHFVGYGASEAGRDYVYTEISRPTMWNLYLPPYEAGVRAGAATLMSSFNDVSGTPSSASHFLMTEVLKERWGHRGFVVSDWDAVRQLINQGVAADGREAALKAFNAGLDMDMMDDLKRHVKHPDNRKSLTKYLSDVLDKKAFDHQGLIYGMGHAVYTLSDPRAKVFKSFVEKLAAEKGRLDDYNLYAAVEEIAPELIMAKHPNTTGVSANVDFYSGFVYDLLGIPRELYTPIFATARIVGWSAHRIEEIVTSNKILRPAYVNIGEPREYVPLDRRGSE